MQESAKNLRGMDPLSGEATLSKLILSSSEKGSTLKGHSVTKVVYLVRSDRNATRVFSPLIANTN